MEHNKKMAAHCAAIFSCFCFRSAHRAANSPVMTAATIAAIASDDIFAPMMLEGFSRQPHTFR
jgi:hypothetical protein